jgi:hypothetical protein
MILFCHGDQRGDAGRFAGGDVRLAAKAGVGDQASDFAQSFGLRRQRFVSVN